MNDFRLARPEDEPELRQLCSLPVPGQWVDLSYQRNPNYFQGLNGCRDEVLVGRYRGGPVAAMAVRSRPWLYVAGKAQQMGYLGGLRIDPRQQGRTLLWEGFQLLHQVHSEGPVQEYLATVVEGNRLAEALLVHKSRPSWPTFHAAGQLCTLALETRPGPAASSDTRQAEEFIRHHGPARPFFPCQAVQTPPERRWWVNHEGVVGAIRDLSACRQTVVHGYHGPLRWLRPLYNLWAHWRGRPPLPRRGGPLRGAYLGYWCSDGIRPQAFAEWLGKALGLAYSQGLHWLYLGLLDSDPYWPVARAFRHRLYRSRFYRVRYQGLPEPVGASAPYLELAWL